MNDLLPAYPRRTSLTVERRGPSGAVVDPGVRLNETALALYELCDGQTGVDEMVDAVAELFGLPPAQARLDVESALADMVAVGLIR